MARAKSSPLSLLLLAVFCFATHVFAVSAVLGVDLGTGYIKAALVKPGIPLEIVLTKDSRRKEISAIAFKPPSNGAPPPPDAYPERLYGSDAMALVSRFPGDVYPNLKSLLGIPADSAQAREYAARHPALKMEAHRLRGTAAFRSGSGLAFAPEVDAWMVEELLAMELQSVRASAEALAGGKVHSAVLTTPPFYTAEERRAVELAADLAGLRVLSLVSDGLAVGINYATSRQFPTVNEGGKPEHHLVFDMGAGSTKATVMRFQSRTVKDVGKFNKTVQEVQVLGAGWDRTLGGNALNYLVVDDMVAQFLDSPKAKQAGVTAEGVRTHGRAVSKLTKEAERLRHVLSANQNTQTSFEGLYEDVDFKYKITRAEFEALAEAQVARVSGTVQRALDAAGLTVADLDSVILHGGASRTAFVQRELETLLGGGDKLRANVNADEAAVFGAGFRAAAISPSFRVKEIRVADAAGYAAGVLLETAGGKARHQQLFVPTSQVGAAAKEVTFSNREDFAATFYQLVPPQTEEAPADGAMVQAETKIFTTKNLTATVAELASSYACEKKDMHLKASVQLAPENGEVDVVKATLECETDEPEKETLMDGVKNLFGFGKSKDGEQKVLDDEKAEGADSSSESTSASSSSSSASSSSSSSGSSSSPPAASESAPASSSAKKRVVAVPVEFTLEPAGLPQLPKADLAALKARIKAFEASDRSRRQREETQNELELYAYKVRDMVDNEAFVAHSTAAERTALEQKGRETSDWMYGDGAEAPLEEIKARLKELQDMVAPVERRVEEARQRPGLVESLQEKLKQTQEFVVNIKEKISEYEKWQSSTSASASAATESSETAGGGGGDFDGLEDDDTAPAAAGSKASTTAKPRDMDDVLAERGPVPPLYALDDLRESEQLHAEYAAWLEAKLAEQSQLAATDEPVLLAKDLAARRERLDKVGMGLAMKAVRNFEGKHQQKKKKSDSSSSSGKSKKGDKMPPSYTDEELQEMLRRLQQEHADADTDAAAKADKAKNKNEKGEPEQPAGEEKKEADEGADEPKKAGRREHEEL